MSVRLAVLAGVSVTLVLTGIASFAPANGAVRYAGDSSNVALDLSPVAVPPGARVTATVTGQFAEGNTVRIQRLTGQHWRTIATAPSKARKVRVADGNTSTLGTFRLRAVVTSAAGVSIGTSDPASLKVERHGPGSSSDYAFLVPDLSDAPHHLKWNPCRPIHYRTDLHGAPPHAAADVREALRRVGQITRLRFVHDGKTTYIPQDNLSQKEPLVIAWAKTKQSSLFAGERYANGVGGAWGSDNYGKQNYLTHGYAVIAIDGSEQSSYQPGFGAGLTNGALLLHEIGHAMGLDHASGTDEIMYYAQFETRVAAIYGAGDYRGLQLQGKRHSCSR